MAHRGRAAPRTCRRPDELVAAEPNRIWSWDITYLPSPVRGEFYYLYLFMDVWSRRITKAVVHKAECNVPIATTAFFRSTSARRRRSSSSIRRAHSLPRPSSISRRARP